ncbi:hypothetical protein Q5A_016860 [Serratia inhibens PRI-2C]|nr:hypothetical protein Q5A_016860 [Serratia inhibens PRI-2C]
MMKGEGEMRILATGIGIVEPSSPGSECVFVPAIFVEGLP